MLQALHQRVLHLDYGAEHQGEPQVEHVRILGQVCLILEEPVDEQVKPPEVLVQVVHLQHPLQEGVTEVVLREYLLPRLPLIILGLLVV
jgi:hypothetical protein